MKKFLVYVLALSAGFGFVNNAFSQLPGNLDTQFNNTGELFDQAIFPFKYSGMAVSPGDQVVVCSASGDTIQAIRFSSSGYRDITFGLNNSGIIQHAVSGFSGSVSATAVQTDRKILIAGQFALTGSNNKAYLLRLNTNGSIDSSFGTNGWIFFSFLPHFGEIIHQVSLQLDGKIVVLDMGNNPGNTDTLIFARFNYNGTYDSSFALNGRYQIPFNNFLATSANVFRLDNYNNLSFAGYSNYLNSDYIYVFRLNSNGALDVSYGNGGIVLIDSTNIINGAANLGLCFQNDGKLVTVQSKLTGAIQFAVCRYNTDGSPDQNFGQNGLVNVQPDLYPVPYAIQNIAVTSTDQIIVAGIVTEAGSNRTIVCSINTDGSANLSFGNNTGSELLNCFELDDIVYNLLIDAHDRILVNGLINEANYQKFQVVRLLAASPTSGISNMAGNRTIAAYPNPATGLLAIELLKPAAGRISLREITGKVLLTRQLNGENKTYLDLSTFVPGVYVLTYENSETSVSEKIIKQ